MRKKTNAGLREKLEKRFYFHSEKTIAFLERSMSLLRVKSNKMIEFCSLEGTEQSHGTQCSEG